MAYLSGLSVGKQPNKGIAAVTGFASGVFHGLKDVEEMRAQRVRLNLAQQEMQLRRRALQHGLDKDKQVTDWSRAFGEYQAWRAGTEDETQIQGPQQSGQAGLGSVPNEGEIDARLMALARSIPDIKVQGALLEEVHRTEQERALRANQGRIAEGLNNRILNQSYTKRLPRGGEDPESGALAAQALLDQVKGAQSNDPQAMAELLDYIEQEDLKLRQQTVAHNVKMQQRDSLIANAEGEIMAREGSGMNMTEAKTVMEMFKAEIIDEQQLSKMMPDAMNGTLQLKMQLMKQDAEIQQLRLQAMKAELGPGGGTLDRTQPQNGTADLNRTQGIPLQQQQAPPTRPLDRAKLIQEEMANIRKGEEGFMEDERSSAAEIRRQATENVDAMLGGESAQPATKGGSEAQAILTEWQSGKITAEEAIERAKKAGFNSFDEVQAAAGGK